MKAEGRGSGREACAAEKPAWRRRPPGRRGNGGGSRRGADTQRTRRAVRDSAFVEDKGEDADRPESDPQRAARGGSLAAPPAGAPGPPRPAENAGGGPQARRAPGVLVGVCSQHLHGHQHGLVGADVQGEVLVFELVHPFHFTEVNLDKRPRLSPVVPPEGLSALCGALPGVN